MSRVSRVVLVALALSMAALSMTALAGARPMMSTRHVKAVPIAHTRVLPKGLLVATLRSAPKSAAAGSRFVLRGGVSNTGRHALSGPLTVKLVKPGVVPSVVGRTRVSAGSGGDRRYAVDVKLPRHLSTGSYALIACVHRNGAHGEFKCATAEEHIQIGAKPAAVHRHTARQVEVCSSGAHSLQPNGSVVYPEMGNGGYTSTHTDVYMAYDPATNLLLPGTHVDLTQLSTKCLSDFSVDFERSNGTTTGPDLTVGSVTVNGQPATVTFIQPTYPGDPNGDTDPDPAAHVMSQANPVSATNPNPPACSPPSTNSSFVGTQCPANKMVITPQNPIPSGTSFTVSITYTGRPGVHIDGDGSTEGWFRSNNPVGDGSFVTSEPVGTEDWMPLNNHPTAKPTYDFYDTAPTGKTAIANGELVGTTTNAPDANFTGGSTTWHWHSPEGIANYLVENSIASFDLSQVVGANGIVFYKAQGSAITATKKATNQAIIDQQDDITQFQSTFNGAFPFTTDGVIVGIPSASFEEEMQTKITFVNSSISLGTFNHENMHQWWGDNVSEGIFEMTFFKEGFAQFSEYLATARTAGLAAGAAGSPAYTTAFDNRLVTQFASTSGYGATGSSWTIAPAKPTPGSLFGTSNTYRRWGNGLIAMRTILGSTRFNAAIQAIQAAHRQGTILEPAAKASFDAYLPNDSAACHAQLATFFTQWWDTAYPSGGGANKPQITGPGLAGPGFYNVTGCTSAIVPTTTASISPGIVGGFYSNPVVTLSATDVGGPGGGSTFYKLDGGAQQTYTGPFGITTDGPHTLTYYSVDSQGNQEYVNTKTFTVDSTPPTTTATITPTPVGGNVPNQASVTLTAVDNTGGSGVASTSYAVDGGSLQPYGGAILLTSAGGHTIAFTSADAAGNVEGTKTVSVVVDPTGSATISAVVTSTLGLSSVSASASLGTFIAGQAAGYSSTVLATLTTTAGSATLTAQDASPGSINPGHLVNGAFSLPTPLRLNASDSQGAATPLTSFTPLNGANPLTLLTFPAPVASDIVTIGVKQAIAQTDALRTGTYGMTVLFTLSTTAP